MRKRKEIIIKSNQHFVLTSSNGFIPFSHRSLYLRRSDV
jgi:hypothetical protein